MQLKNKITLSFLVSFFIGVLIYVLTLFACLRFDIQFLWSILLNLLWIYLVFAAVGLVITFLLSKPLVKFMDDFENRNEITNEQAFGVQKRASYFSFYLLYLNGLMILSGSLINAYYLYVTYQLSFWQIVTFPFSGFIAGLVVFLSGFFVIENIMYQLRELADQKNSLPSLNHPGPTLFFKLFLSFLAFALSIILFISLFMHNSIMYEYQYFKADPKIFERTIYSLRYGMLIFSIFGAFFSYIVASAFTSISLLPLRKLGKYLKAISNGDLTHRLLSGASDEFFSICRSATYMVNSLKLMVLRAKDMGVDITDMVRNIRYSEEQQAHGAIETAKTLANTISTLHNLASSASHVHLSAERVAQTAQATLSTSEISKKAISTIKGEMKNIKSKVSEVVRRITTLEDRSHQISTIATMIDEITEQTNLLSVNASLEASRAGEAGKGFAQVATEIRKLAERAANSTKEIEGLIGEIQEDTHLTVGVTRESSASVKKSVDSIQQTAESIDKINNMIAETTSAANDILKSSTDQKSSTDRIVTRIQGWSQVAHQFEASTHSLVESTKNLKQLADDLKDAISGFKVE